MRMRTTWAPVVIAVIAALTIFFGLELRNIKIEGGTDFLPPSSPVEQAISRMERVFGSSEVVSVMMRLDQGTVFSPATLTLITDVTSRLEALPGVHDVRSLSNSDYVQAAGGALVVGPLMPEGQVTEAVAKEVQQRSLSWEMYRGLFFSSDMRATQWIVTLRTGPQATKSYSATLEAIRKVVAPYEDGAHRFMVSGQVAVMALLVSGITRDLTHLLPILVVILIGILFFAFRKISGVLLPLATVVMSTIWTMGLMALFGVPINIMGTAIPLLLVTVGSAYGIHFLSHYFAEEVTAASESHGRNGRSGAEGSGPHTDVLRRTISRVGLPILLAGVTTVAGFGSLGSASVPAILQMGMFTAVGILCALLLTFTFVPAALNLAHRRGGAAQARLLTATVPADGEKQPTGPAPAGRDGHTARALTAVYDLFAKRQPLLLAVVAALIAISAFGISRIQIGQPTVNFFRASSPIRAASRFADEDFGGATIMYVLVRPTESTGTSETPPGSAAPAKASTAAGTGSSAGAKSDGVSAFGAFGDLSKMSVQENNPIETKPGLTDPRVLSAVGALEQHLKATYPAGVGRISSLVMMIKQMNRVMHDGENAYYEVPSNPAKYGATGPEALRKLIAQYLLLYSGNLSSFVDSTDHPTELRLVVQLVDSQPAFLQKVKKEITSYGDSELGPLGYRVTTVGLPDEMLAMSNSIMRSQVTSLSIALLCVLIALWIAYRSIRVGLAGLIPIVLSLMLNFAVMGFLHIPLDVVTAIIASVAVGIGIDYSIHVVSAYIYEYRLTGDTNEAAHRTLGLTGRAIFFNVASVTVGFAVLVFSMFTPLNSLGILMGVIMVTSSFFAMTLLPVVLRGIVPRLPAAKRPLETQPSSDAPAFETTNWRNP